MGPIKAQQMADMARDCGDPAGHQRCLGMVAAAKAAQAPPPTIRQQFEKLEAQEQDLQKKLQGDIEKLDRWKK